MNELRIIAIFSEIKSRHDRIKSIKEMLESHRNILNALTVELAGEEAALDSLHKEIDNL